MPGKVFHVSDDVHEAVKAWCEAKDLRPKLWVEDVLKAALQRRVVETGESENDDTVVTTVRVVEEPTPGAFPKPDPVPVEKKTAPETPPSNSDEPWSRPPFWANQQGTQ